MARKVSPFAALTNEEKQIKWMEYQTIRLPYTTIAQEGWSEQAEKTNPPENEASEKSQFSKESPIPPHATNPSNRPLPPPEVYGKKQGGPSAAMRNTSQTAYQQMNEFQKSHHRQYEAVIQRMKQAEKNTGAYCAWIK